jgi:hypothetical protein
MRFCRKIAEARANLTHQTRGLARTIERRKSVCKDRPDRGDCRCKSTCPDQNFRNLMRFYRKIAEARANLTHQTRGLARTIEPRKSGCKDRPDRVDRGSKSICSEWFDLNSMPFCRKMAKARAHPTHSTRGLARTIELRTIVRQDRPDRPDPLDLAHPGVTLKKSWDGRS